MAQVNVSKTEVWRQKLENKTVTNEGYKECTTVSSTIKGIVLYKIYMKADSMERRSQNFTSAGDVTSMGNTKHIT